MPLCRYKHSVQPPMESTAALRRRRRRRVADADRKRAPRACDRCKVRKNKCVETASGVCVRCFEGSYPCRFERARSPQDESSSPSTGRRTTAATDPGPGDRTPEPDGSAAIHAGSPLRQNINDGFSPGGGAPTEASTWLRFLSRLREAFCLDSQPAPEERDMVRLQAGLSRTPSIEPAEARRLKKAVNNFPPRPVAEFLLSVCITYGTDVFFYFDQAQLMQELAAFYSDEQSRLRTDTGFVCLALAVFALGSHWTSLAKPEDTGADNSPEDVDPGRLFYNQARTLMADLIDRPCLRSVQAAYVIGVYLMPASAISASYVYMGLALRKALAIGLHLEPDDPMLSEDEKEMRRRLWWSIYSLERTVTIKLNRPRSISQHIVTAHLPRPTARDQSQRFDNVQHQIANAQLVGIIDRLSDPTSRPDSNNPRHTTVYDAALMNWRNSLPASLRLQNIQPSSPSYRAVFHLHLNYYFAYIDRGKVSVVTVVRARLRARIRPDGEPPRINEGVVKAAEACVRAAKKMLELFENLSSGGNMARFSFTDLQGCSVATIVVLLAGILDRDSGYEGRVAFGLDCLRKMAVGGNATAGMGVRFVEALQSITNEARSKLLRSQAPKDDLQPSSFTERNAGYEQWADWIANAEVAESISDDDDTAAQQQPEVPIPEAGSTDPTRDSLPPAWDEAAALQLPEVSASEFGLPLGHSVPAAGNQDSMAHATIDESWLASFAWNDDQMYLMGLTGMDVLDFTGGFEQS